MFPPALSLLGDFSKYKMPEKSKDNIRKMFHEFDEGDIRVNSVTGEVVAVGGFIRGQSVRAKAENGIVESDWRIMGFDITEDNRNDYKVTIKRGEEPNLVEEIISLKELRELNLEK